MSQLIRANFHLPTGVAKKYWFLWESLLVIYFKIAISVTLTRQALYQEAQLLSLNTRFSYWETRLSSREKQGKTGNSLLSSTVLLEIIYVDNSKENLDVDIGAWRLPGLSHVQLFQLIVVGLELMQQNWLLV